MYKLIFWTIGSLAFWLLGFFFLHTAVPVWQVIASAVLFVGSAVTVFSNTETSIEQPRYGIAVVLALLPLVFIAIAAVNYWEAI